MPVFRLEKIAFACSLGMLGMNGEFGVLEKMDPRHMIIHNIVMTGDRPTMTLHYFPAKYDVGKLIKSN